MRDVNSKSAAGGRLCKGKKTRREFWVTAIGTGEQTFQKTNILNFTYFFFYWSGMFVQLGHDAHFPTPGQFSICFSGLSKMTFL